MSITVCEKCKGPVTLENGKYVCAICGAVYEDKKEKSESKNSSFFEKVSFEKLRAVNNLITDVVSFRGVAIMSNGQTFQSGYENFWGARKIQPPNFHEIALAYDGTMLLQSEPQEKLVRKLKKIGVTELKMKMVARFSVNEDCFAGIDINGKVIIYNPYEVFGLNSEKEEERNECVNRLNEIKSWPPMKFIDYYCTYGISEEGKVYTLTQESSKMKGWENIESIALVYGHFMSKIYFGLKTDGTLVMAGRNETSPFLSKDISEYSGIVQMTDMYYYDEFYSGNIIILLNNKGEFICRGRVIDRNVIAIGDQGYVKANGSVYQRIESFTEKGLKYKKIEGLRLFDSVYTIEKEYEEAFHYRENLKASIKNTKAELEAKQEELRPIQDQYDNLGIFKGKEKKALKPSIDALSEEIKGLEEELNNLKVIHKAMTTLWVPSTSTTQNSTPKPTYYGNPYSAADLGAAARNAISGNKKDKSVIGSAAVGGLIAGPAGAVVGAIYAADKNNKNKK